MEHKHCRRGEGRVKDKVGMNVVRPCTYTRERDLSFTQMLFGSGVELLIAITVSFRKNHSKNASYDSNSDSNNADNYT